MFTNLINVSQYDALTRAGTSYLVLDCRAKLGDSQWGAKAFSEGHLPGALYANLDTDLAASPGEGGRHPLPPFEKWLETLGHWGLQPDQQVILYDDAGGAYAARAWWMLRWAGHEAAAVLDGGWQAWLNYHNLSPSPDLNESSNGKNPDDGQDNVQNGLKDAIELGSGRVTRPTKFSPGSALVEQIETEQLLKLVTDTPGQFNLIDARTQARWAGLEEPIDPVAGHIPGARCLPFQANLDEDGFFLSAETLRQRFTDSTNAISPICYCGSGVTAAHNILAMHIAGITNAVLYVSSWSGWITDDARPIARQQDNIGS